MKTLIIIPSKNSYKTILETIDAIRTHTDDNVDYLVVDYGSTDQTKYLLINKNINHIIFPLEGTYGEAVSLGFKYAKEKGYDCLIEWNQDNKFDPRDINYFIMTYKNNNYDFILGTRYIENKRKRSQFGSRRLTRAIWYSTGYKISDPTFKLKLYGKETIAALSKLKYLYSGPDTTAHLIKAGYSYKELQVRVNSRFKNNVDKGIIYTMKNSMFIFLMNPIAKKGKLNE